MNTPVADPAGAIRVRLQTASGRVAGVELASSRRTDFARRLFAGRSVAQLLDTLPRVFSVCATAQACAAAGACERAAGVSVAPAHEQARELLALAETAREHLFRILLGWSTWLQAPPGVSGLAVLGRMRAAWAAALYPQGDAFRPGGGSLAPDEVALAGLLGELDALGTAALGVPAAQWSALDGPAALVDWVERGDTVAQRLLRTVLERGHAALGASDTAPLPDLDPGLLADRLSGADGAAFAAAPLWDGVPRETGALPRQGSHPLVAGLRVAHGNALLTRLAARLAELAAVIGRIRVLAVQVAPTAAGTIGVASGSALAQVEAARGRLVHWVRLADGVVTDYRILAPTEWNFHPQGALARGLATLPADDTLPQLARLLVDAIDPCVEAHVEVRDA